MLETLEPARRAKGILGHLGFVAALRARRAFSDAAKAELDALLATDRRLPLAPRGGRPAISVVVVLYNQAHLTLRCLGGLLAQRDTPFETIIVDNASTDLTPSLLDRVDGAIVIRNAGNVGFLRAANEGAARASAPALLFLNNDAVPLPDALGRAVSQLRRDDSIGALGARIVFPHGRLQEAGPIVFSNGFVIGYGMGSDPDRGQFRLSRESDFANGAFLATPRRLFAELGGFDDAYEPAYKEDADYGFRVRQAGYRVVYDPTIRLVHLAHGSKTSLLRPFRQMARNRPLFRQRHHRALDNRIAPNWFNYARVCLGAANRRWVLVIGGDRSAGVKRRIVDLCRIIGNDGGWVSVIAEPGEAATAPPFWSREGAPAAADTAEILSAYRPWVSTIVVVGPVGRPIEQALAALTRPGRRPDVVIDTGIDSARTGAAESRRVPGVGGFRVGDAAAMLRCRQPVREAAPAPTRA